jgi:hypothetical protein
MSPPEDIILSQWKDGRQEKIEDLATNRGGEKNSLGG